VSDIPDNVDLGWVARTLLAPRRDVQALRDDFGVALAILHRVDNNQAAYREEMRALFDPNRDWRARIDAIENKP
jgi:hypothetical protein